MVSTDVAHSLADALDHTEAGDRAVKDAESNGGCLSVARFSFEETNDGRAHLDAARLFSRLVRNIDG